MQSLDGGRVTLDWSCCVLFLMRIQRTYFAHQVFDITNIGVHHGFPSLEPEAWKSPSLSALLCLSNFW